MKDFLHSISDDTKLETLKTVAGAGVGGGGFAITLNEVVLVLTAVYMIGSIGLLVPKYVREYREWKSKK
jgi:hypothetical protein